MADLWLTPETDESPPGLAKDDEGNLILCDDCPCGGCGSCSTTYTMSGFSSSSHTTSYTATLSSALTPSCFSPNPAFCFWQGNMVATGPAASAFNTYLVVLYGDPTTPTQWRCRLYTSPTGCGINAGFIISASNSCPDGPYSIESSPTFPSAECTIS